MLRQYQQSTNLANVPRLAGATDVSDWDEGAPNPRRCFRGSNRLIDLADDPYNEDITVQIDVFEGDNESIELTSSTSWQAATRPSDDACPAHHPACVAGRLLQNSGPTAPNFADSKPAISLPPATHCE